jgi:hypothetical protein
MFSIKPAIDGQYVIRSIRQYGGQVAELADSAKIIPIACSLRPRSFNRARGGELEWIECD